MIGGIFFLGSIIAIFIVLNWFVKNDRVPADSPITGFLAMKMSTEDVKKRGPRRWTREDALRRQSASPGPSSNRTGPSTRLL